MTPDQTKLAAFMKRRGWKRISIRSWVNVTMKVVTNDEAATYWYTETAKLLEPMEHNLACCPIARFPGNPDNECSIDCHADQINELLSERRKAAGL